MLQPFSHCIHDGTAIEALFPDTGPIARNPVHSSGITGEVTSGPLGFRQRGRPLA